MDVCACVQGQRGDALPTVGWGTNVTLNLSPSRGRRHWGADSWVRMMFLKKGICRELTDPLLFQVAASMTPSSAGRDS